MHAFWKKKTFINETEKRGNKKKSIINDILPNYDYKSSALRVMSLGGHYYFGFQTRDIEARLCVFF